MMQQDLEQRLVAWSAEHSGHEVQRAYVGLSGIGDCERVIFDRYVEGTPATVGEQLKTAVSYELERAVQARLAGLGLWEPGPAICLYDGLVQGHTDGMTPGHALIEIKTVALAEHLPHGRLPQRVLWQVTAYMRWTGLRPCHVVYLARDAGALQVYTVDEDLRLSDMVHTKLVRVVTAIREGRRPGCSCGRCGRPPTTTDRRPQTDGRQAPRAGKPGVGRLVTR